MGALDRLRGARNKEDVVEESRVYNEPSPRVDVVQDVRYKEDIYQDRGGNVGQDPRHTSLGGRYMEGRYSESVDERVVNSKNDRRYYEERNGGYQEVLEPRNVKQYTKVSDVHRQEVIEDDYRIDPRNDYNRSRNLPVDRVAVPTDLSYANPDRFGLQVLGLNGGGSVRLIKSKVLDIAPLELSNIVDSTGKVSEKLHAYMMRFGVTVLPFERMWCL